MLISGLLFLRAMAWAFTLLGTGDSGGLIGVEGMKTFEREGSCVFLNMFEMIKY